MRRRDPDEVEGVSGGDEQMRQQDQLMQNVHWAEKEYLRTIAKALKIVEREKVTWQVGDIAKKVEQTLALPSGSLEETLRGLEERAMGEDY